MKLFRSSPGVFVSAAVVLSLAGILEWTLERVGVSLWLGYIPRRFLELAAFSLLPVTVILLREIREEMRNRKPV